MSVRVGRLPPRPLVGWMRVSRRGSFRLYTGSSSSRGRGAEARPAGGDGCPHVMGGRIVLQYFVSRQRLFHRGMRRVRGAHLKNSVRRALPQTLYTVPPPPLPPILSTIPSAHL